MSVQKVVNNQLALGIPGSFYDTTPRRVHPYIVEANSTALPAFGLVVTKNANGNAQPGGTGAFLGVICDPKSIPLYGGLTPSLQIPVGTAVPVCSFGHLVVTSAAAVTADSSLPIYNTTTGAISAVAANSQSAGEGNAFIPGAKFKFVNAAEGKVCVLELNGAN